jgi:hypothetical protein
MLYYLESSPGRRPRGLADFLAQYDIASAVCAYDVMSDGSSARGGYPYFTCLGLGVGGLTGGLAGAVTGGAVGVLADYIAGWGQRREPEPKPVPVAAVAEVQLHNVSVLRVRWAEYCLCKWTVRNRWAVRTADGDLVDERNEEYARRSTRAPRPWKKR